MPTKMTRMGLQRVLEVTNYSFTILQERVTQWLCGTFKTLFCLFEHFELQWFESRLYYQINSRLGENKKTSHYFAANGAHTLVHIHKGVCCLATIYILNILQFYTIY